MSKPARRRRTLTKSARRAPNKRKALICACLAFGLAVAGIVIARRSSVGAAPAHAPLALAPPQTSQTPALSKELVYAGPKLVAIEEPTPPAPSSGGHSLSLNGASAYAQVAPSASLDITGALTVEGWINYNPNGNYQEIVARESYGQAGGGGGYALQITNTGKLRFITYQGGASYVAVVGSTTVSAGVWRHVAGVFDGASTRRVYLDGVQDGSASSAGSAPTSGTADLKIGRLSGNSQFYFQGLIDEVRLSNSALYGANFTPQTSLTAGATTKGLWKFAGQTGADSSGLGNDASPEGAAAYSTDTP